MPCFLPELLGRLGLCNRLALLCDAFAAGFFTEGRKIPV